MEDFVIIVDDNIFEKANFEISVRLYSPENPDLGFQEHEVEKVKKEYDFS